PPPPPENPPKPLPPDDDGMLAYIVPVAVVPKLSTAWASTSASKGWLPTNHPDCSCSASIPSNAFAHFFVQPKTIAYGRYCEKMSCCTAKRARMSSSPSSNRRRKPRTRESIAVPRPELADRQPAPHREVDDRRGDVEQVGVLVEQHPDLAGTDRVGRDELDRTVDAPEDRKALLLAGHVAHRGVDGRAGEPAVAPAT